MIQYKCINCGKIATFGATDRVPPCYSCGSKLYAKLRKHGHKRIQAE